MVESAKSGGAIEEGGCSLRPIENPPRRSPRFLSSTKAKAELHFFDRNLDETLDVYKNRKGLKARSSRVSRASQDMKNKDTSLESIIEGKELKNEQMTESERNGRKKSRSYNAKKVFKRVSPSRSNGNQKKVAQWWLGREKKNEDIWQHMLPLDVLASISDLLPLDDFIKFCSVCHSWRSAPSLRASISKFDKDIPWLIVYGFENERSDDYLLLQPSSKVSCILKLPALKGATILASKAGWLLCRNGIRYFFYNPFSFEVFDLPDYSVSWEPSSIQVASFSSPPNSNCCIAFLINGKGSSKLEVSWCRPSKNKGWTTDLVDIGANFKLTGDALCAVQCSCRAAGLCNCERFNEVVVWQSNRWIVYNILKRRLTIGECSPSRKTCCWYDMVKTNLNDLLGNFVKQDAFITCSPLHMTREDGLYLIPFEYRPMTGRNNGTGDVHLKAAWIEPTFPWQ
ncbi:hypothetical protein HPP92_002134 [Vanilla planifolia]|uniref:F-box domain-containing protein n=1 Tax=Vanilla planifolia TaxID=51239 RepID=A0A835RVA8_VANPL|nr:hypothetical protein HPP92_002134 [Vanilla planifolia]